MSTFNVGGSATTAPVPRREVQFDIEQFGDEDAVWGADPWDIVTRAKREYDTIVHAAQQWNGELEKLNEEIIAKSDIIQQKQDHLEQLSCENDQMVQNVKQTEQKFKAANNDLDLMIRARNEQVKENEFTRGAILEENEDLTLRKTGLVDEIGILRAKKIALNAYILQGERTRNRNDNETSSDLESDDSASTPNYMSFTATSGGGRGLTVEQTTSTPGPGRARGRAWKPSVVDPIVGISNKTQILSTTIVGGHNGPAYGGTQTQEQLAIMQAAQHERLLKEQQRLDEEQAKLLAEQRKVLDEQRKRASDNAQLAQEVAESEAAHLKKRSVALKLVREQEANALADKTKCSKDAETAKLAKEQVAARQYQNALQHQCHYMSDAEKAWWYNQGTDPTAALVDYGLYQSYLQRLPASTPPLLVNNQANPVNTSSVSTGNITTKRPPRRSVLSERVEQLYTTNPAIAGLGLDNITVQADGCEAIAKCVQMAGAIRRSENAARRVASEPKPYWQRNPWDEYLKSVCEEVKLSGWSHEEALPYLSKGLRDGDGVIAVEQWEEDCGLSGTFLQLVETASWLFGGINAIDPMVKFKQRVQLKNELPKVFGLALTRLLRKVHPKSGLHDELFTKELFTQFCGGLRDSDVQQVVYDTWRADSSLNDLFRAIDNHTLKRSLLGEKGAPTGVFFSK